MDYKNSGVFLFCMLTLFNCGALFFLVGFFPDAYNAIDLTEKSEGARPTNVSGLRITPSKRQHDQIILMIIDALRFDFMTANNLPFTHSKKCNLLKLRVAVPTVTMPRIKSMMTGKLSNFIDVIRNLGEAEQLTDSLIHVLRKGGEIINFAGDRTWDQLFPTQFTRKKANLDSFFVQDFYEGDMQVKETLSTEINQTDWSLLILHFLGLDHIGHVEGSKSDKIPDKLLEMDEVMRNIYENSLFKNRLLLVTGDHGMRNGGGHGGSTEEEVKVPLVFFMENCNKEEPTKKEYNQIDLTPTLAILFSVDIPKPSIGCLIPEMLVNLTFEEKLYAFFYNAHHLMEKATAKYGEKDVERAGYSAWYKSATLAHRQFLEAKTKNLPAVFHYEQALADYKRVAEGISTRMADALVTYDNSVISIGLFLTTAATIYTLLSTLFVERKSIQKRAILNLQQALISFALTIVITIACHMADSTGKSITKIDFLGVFLTAAAIYIGLGILSVLQQILLPLQYTSSLRCIWSFPIPVTLFYVLTIVLLASSSYVEYEEFSSHYLGCSCVLILMMTILLQRYRKDVDDSKRFKERFIFAIHNMRSEILMSISILIVMRLFRQPEILGKLDNEKWFQILKGKWLGLYFPIGLLLLIVQLQRLNTIKQMVPSVLATLSIFCFRAVEGQTRFGPDLKLSSSLVLLLFWACVLITALLEFKSFLRHNAHIQFLKTFLSCSLLTAALLHKPHNVILLPSMLFVLDKIYYFCDNLNLKIREPYKQNHILAYKTLMTIFVANMFYFYQGNSNSLATIDLNPGYIGQSTYNPVIVAIFLTINTYSAPIIAFFYLIYHILKNDNNNGTNLNTTFSLVSPSDENLRHVLGLYTAATLLPAAVYLGYLIFFRYHLFIYSVFAPKFFYECYSVIVFHINYCVVQLFLYVFKKI